MSAITDGPNLREVPYIFEPFTFESEPFCQEAFTPTAVFEWPDTLCKGAYQAPATPSAVGANTSQWTISGQGLDTVLQLWQLFPFEFTTPGTYTITHQVWLLGCEDVYERQVVILDSLQLNLAETYYLCPDEPLRIDLNATSNRRLREVRLDSVAVTGPLTFTQPGTYSITASDSYRGEVTDTIQIRLLEDDFPPPWLTLDTTDYRLCPEDFPLALTPRSDYTSQFLLDSGAAQAIPLAILRAGNYTVAAQVANCQFNLPVRVEERDCSPSVYLPNVFSPNRDGVNDRLFPQGTDFQALRLQIFDRWGQLVYTDTSDAPAWNGQIRGRVAPAGVYVAVFEFVNLKNDQTVTQTQDVVLVR
ncbi:MAG: gliding motility-associated C-terminal domain-containing protein [Bacteroidota bacterium]